MEADKDQSVYKKEA